ncbi:MAG: hypothetical protein M3237_18575 [Actinomycetota bacterium]|nr:hypothetical protein [Actinomycetota bacterium]
MVAIVSMVLVAVAAFAVDLGMHRVVRRDMQALADAVALDLARLVDGRTADQIEAGSSKVRGIEAAKVASEARNEGSTLGDDPVVAWTLVQLDLMGDPVKDAAGDVVPVTGSVVPDAVFVTATTAVDFAFSTGSGASARSAIGLSQSTACFRLGSYALAVESGNSALLDHLIGDALDINAVGYTGLADANITMRGLALALGVGTVDELASLENLTLQRLFLASATVLERESGQAADVTLLKTIAAAVNTTTVINIADMLTVSGGGAAALDTKLNVLDLVAGSAFVANGENAFDVPVFWKVPQFSSGSAGLTIIQKPQLGCGKVGEASAQTAQVTLFARPTLNIPTIAGLAGPGVPVDFEVELASADGLLTGVTCGAGTLASPESIDVHVRRALVSNVNLSIPIQLSGQISAAGTILHGLPFGLGDTLGSVLRLLLGNDKATINIMIQAGVSASSQPTEEDATYAVPPHDYTDPERVDELPSLTVPDVTIDNVDFSGTITYNNRTLDVSSLLASGDITLNAVINDLVSKNVLTGVNEFIAEVNAYLIPTLELLGASTAGADLYGVYRPACNNPSLGG